jgi:hypothetical protein
MHLIEAERDVERWRGLYPFNPLYIPKQILGGYPKVTDAPLEEVAGERSLWSEDQAGGRGPAGSLPEHGAEPAEVLFVAAFARPELGNREGKHGGNIPVSSER